MMHRYPYFETKINRTGIPLIINILEDEGQPFNDYSNLCASLVWNFYKKFQTLLKIVNFKIRNGLLNKECK
jgi:hypothetical protein